MNLTREQIALLLTGLAARLGGGLTQERARQFEAELDRLTADDDVILEETVVIADARMPFVLDVFGSENEALEAGFIAPAAVAGIVMEEAQRLFGNLPIRHMAATPET